MGNLIISGNAVILDGSQSFTGGITTTAIALTLNSSTNSYSGITIINGGSLTIAATAHCQPVELWLTMRY